MTGESIDERVERLSNRFPVVDTHNDFPYLVRSQLHNEFVGNPDFDFNHTTAHTDLTRLRKGKVGLQFFSCWIECKDPDIYYQDFNKPNNVVRDTMEQFDVVQRLCKEYEMNLVSNSQDAIKSFKEGKFTCTLGIEGLHQVDLSLGVLRLYFELGVRYATLTHNCDNPFATAASSVSGGLKDKGLTKYGEECVAEMNRLGMMVDLSHVSIKTMEDTLKVTKSPIIYSHSSCYSLTPHPRNVPDDILLKVKENSGVICINFFPVFLQQGDKECTIDDAVDHIVHVVETIGWDYVGMGSDFDGISNGPKGLEDVSKYPDLIKKVIERTNCSDEDIIKFMGGNVMRVWRANEVIAEHLKNEKPCETNWDKRTWPFYSYVKTFPELFPGSKGSKPNVYSNSQSLVNK